MFSFRCLLPFVVFTFVLKLSGASFTPIRFLDRQPPVANPETKGISESGLAANELVLGVSVNGESRAYPLNMMNRPEREVINDMLGGTPIAVTWCSRCHSGSVFVRRVKDRTLTFGIEGTLWLNNMVMYDTETDSRWAQFTGHGEAGPMEGTDLERVPSVVTDWESWKKLHPESSVLRMEKVANRYVSQLQKQRGKYVLGYDENGKARGYPFDVLKEHQILNDQVGGEPVLVSFDPESTTALMFSRRVGGDVLKFKVKDDDRMSDESGSVWDRLQGKCVSGKYQGKTLRSLPAQVALQVTWMRFHPGSEIQGYQ